ncbi:hypothetical protein VRU48_01220 [Pedobacter sp. KR3-3]|uniref:TonB-dependent receptor plug domain-containing protein n=1 Tax=Pedobacter albus TaxID=3113905 RepID=A0ABU7I2L8_9SPHI|nr:hypothetical protein [Pedobacter sp. KR3-3]MEE1943707.1 hypothetical protein [Pedobacter sp. KR3-3]
MKKRLFLPALVAVGFIALSGFLLKDDGPLSSFIEKLEQYTSKNPQEKVHLHLDKPYYSIGEDIWFSAYVVNAEENKLSLLSKVLYVDIVDEKGKVKKTQVLPLENGLSNGNIDLSDTTFRAGTYQLRAYTNWMRNFDDAFLFRKEINIGDALYDKVMADTKFELNPSPNGTALKATLSYTNFDNEPEINKEVSYNLVYEGNKLFSGTGRTDSKGIITVNYNLKKDYTLSKLLLNTVFNKNDAIKVAKTVAVVNQAKTIDLQFFPEGGNLVSGIRSKVAFKAVDENGMGTAVEGYVQDKEGKKVAAISSEHLGMGLFAFTPVAGQQYTAVIAKDGEQKRYQLPQAMATGYVLSLNHLDDENLLLRINCSPALAQDNEVIVVAQSNGIIKYTTKIKLDKESVSSKLPKNMLSEGIVQFTLFTANMSPLAERLVFVHRNDGLHVKFSTPKESYGKREQVDLALHVEDAKANGEVGSFSVSVVNQDKVNQVEDNETTILSNLLLTSDLKGNIEKPNYYFTAIDATKIRNLDLLMLTQGWRRFKWSDVMQPEGQANFKFNAEASFAIHGTIVNLNNKPIPYGKINLFVPSTLLLMDTVADANGRFVFDNLVFPDSTTVILRAKNAKERNNAQILIDNRVGFSSLPLAKTNGAKDAVFVSYLAAAQQRFSEMGKYGLINGSILLKPVEIKTSRNPPIYKSALPAISPPDYTITPDKLQSSTNVLNFFTGMAGISVRSNIIYGRRKAMEGPMLLLLDGRPIKDATMIDPSTLAGIQIVRAGAYSSGIGLNLQEPADPVVDGPQYKGLTNVMSSAYGIVFFTTDWRAKPKPALGLSRLKAGYTLTKEFYAPVYDVPEQHKEMADLRSTIYWKPDLITDDRGNAHLKFFTADEPGKYLVTLEGVGLSGQLVRKNYSFTVK